MVHRGVRTALKVLTHSVHAAHFRSILPCAASLDRDHEWALSAGPLSLTALEPAARKRGGLAEVLAIVGGDDAVIVRLELGQNSPAFGKEVLFVFGRDGRRIGELHLEWIAV